MSQRVAGVELLSWTVQGQVWAGKEAQESGGEERVRRHLVSAILNA